jgi:hypothetical protein
MATASQRRGALVHRDPMAIVSPMPPAARVAVTPHGLAVGPYCNGRGHGDGHRHWHHRH